jgi:CheY-like chemotaxis protein
MKQKTRQIHIRISEELYRNLKVKCIYEDTSIQDHVVKLIAENMGERSARGVVAIPRNSVLIVDDEPIVRESLKDWFKDSYRLATAETGEEAVELMQKQHFDILILDVRLPGKSGIQVLKDVKEIKPHIRPIVITAYPSVELAVEAMKLGAVDYLTKPVSPRDLEKLIEKTLDMRKSEHN